MKPIIKLNNYDLDIFISKDFAKEVRKDDILCVYNFDEKESADWVTDFNGEVYDDTEDIFPVDKDYREENGYFKLKITEREFRDDELIFWADIYSTVGEVDFP